MNKQAPLSLGEESGERRKNPSGVSSLYRSRKYKGSIYPTGEFSFGMDVANYTQEKLKSSEYERIHALQYHDLVDEDGNAWMRLPLDVAQVYDPDATQGQEERLELGLSSLRNYHKRPERYGAKGLTSYGSRMVKSAAYLLEEKYGKERLTFGTYTLPSMPEGFRAFLHENWGEFVRQIFQHIKRELERKNADSTDYVAVTEIQQKRLRAFGSVYLHLHFVILGRSQEGAYYLTTRKSDRILHMVLRGMVDKYKRKSGTEDQEIELDTKSSGNLQRVRKSVVGYIGKYMSKGRSNHSQVSDFERSKYYPRQWWTASRMLKDSVRKRIKVLTHELCDAIANDESMQAIWVKWIKPVIKEWDGQEYVLGYIGGFNEGWECLLEPSAAELPNVDSENAVSLDSSAKIRIRRRQVSLESACRHLVCRRSESVKADRVKSER